MTMEQCSETSAYKIQTLGNYPEESIQLLQSDLKVSVHLTQCIRTIPTQFIIIIIIITINDLKMAITEYIRNADRAILNTVFENTVRRVNKCLETGGGHFENYS
jgi:hypothetical protein